MTQAPNRKTAARVSVAVALWLCAAVPSGAAKPPPPAKRTYFVTTLGITGPVHVDSGCMTFTARGVCLDTLDPTDPTLCGTWSSSGETGDDRVVSFDIEWDASGVLLGIDGRAQVEDRGRGSAIGGAARLAAPDLGLESNWSFSGKETKRRECRRLGLEFLELANQWTALQCRKQADFGPPARSPYVLPYPIGESHRLGQAYCEPTGSHRDSFAYDFDMPVGTPIVAVRDGVVWMAIDEFEDGDRRPEHGNDIFIQHADGSVAQYAHLRHGSFLVEPGDRVTAGQQIASSGDTGIVHGPAHLHFEIYASTNALSGRGVPVNFRNAGGPLDERGGLIVGQTYEALPY